MNDLDFYYWDVFPKHIKLTCTYRDILIQLSLRGNPNGFIEFESADEDIAWVDDGGILHCGYQPGNTLITVYNTTRTDSLRYIHVEITEPVLGEY